MALLFVIFQTKLWRFYLLSHLYSQEFIYLEGPHISHHHYRRFSKRYKKKQGLVKNIWIGVGLFAIIFPFLPLIMVLTLSTTFVSFTILDETE